MERYEVLRAEGAVEGGSHDAFLGSGPFGQLTSLGFKQCREVGADLRRRYPGFAVHAYSTNFPRTIDSAKAVLCGLAEEIKKTPAPSITVRSSSSEFLLPNYDGRCTRYDELLAARRSAAEEHYSAHRAILEEKLKPLLGGSSALSRLKCANHFKGMRVHLETIGPHLGVDDDLICQIDDYFGHRYAFVYGDAELVRLGSGRLLHRAMQTFVVALDDTTPHLHVCLAHDSTLVPLMVALGVHAGDWPKYASTVVVEIAEKLGQGPHVRVLVNNEVRRDWQQWELFRRSVAAAEMTETENATVCQR